MINIKAITKGRIPTQVIEPEDLRAFAEIVVAGIRRRSMAGRSYTGRKFIPYTPGYIASGKGGPVPDLHDTGTMLRTITIRVKKTSAIIVAVPKYAWVNNARRPFMGVDDKDGKAIEALANARAARTVDGGTQ